MFNLDANVVPKQTEFYNAEKYRLRFYQYILNS